MVIGAIPVRQDNSLDKLTGSLSRGVFPSSAWEGSKNFGFWGSRLHLGQGVKSPLVSKVSARGWACHWAHCPRPRIHQSPTLDFRNYFLMRLHWCLHLLKVLICHLWTFLKYHNFCDPVLAYLLFFFNMLNTFKKNKHSYQGFLDLLGAMHRSGLGESVSCWGPTRDSFWSFPERPGWQVCWISAAFAQHTRSPEWWELPSNGEVATQSPVLEAFTKSSVPMLVMEGALLKECLEGILSINNTSFFENLTKHK